MSMVVNPNLFDFPFPSVTDLAGRWRADLGITKDGSDFVSQWNDQSGNARNLAEATNKPLWVANGINGKPAIQFDGSNDFLAATFTLAQPNHFFIVFKANTWTSSDVLVCGVSGDGGLHAVKQSGSTPQVVHNAGSATGNTVSPALGSNHLVNSFFSGASSKQKLNNGSYVTGTSIGTTGVSKLQVGGLDTGASCLDGLIAEICLFSAEKTTTELTSLETYFKNRYGLW